MLVLYLNYIDAIERHDDVVNLCGAAVLVGQQQVVDCDVFILRLDCIYDKTPVP